MALKLTDESESGRQVQRVAVRLCDGFPVALAPYEEKLTHDLPEIVGMYRPDLQSFQRGLDALHELLGKLSDLSPEWEARAKHASPDIEGLWHLAEELLELSKRATFIDALAKIEEDILGAYFPLGKVLGRNGMPVIEIYWSVIGAFAKSLDIDVEGLTVTVLAHELAHAYSHKGADTDGDRWGDVAFCNSTVFIKEGIAQYYTEKIVRWLRLRNLETPHAAYSRLLKCQSPPYRIHEQWSSDYSQEAVRAAIIECRNKQTTKTEEFVGFMKSAKARLSGPPAQRDLIPSADD